MNQEKTRKEEVKKKRKEKPDRNLTEKKLRSLKPVRGTRKYKTGPVNQKVPQSQMMGEQTPKLEAMEHPKTFKADGVGPESNT